MTNIFYFTLENENFNYGRLYRIQKDACLRLKCSSSLINQTLRVFSNLTHGRDCKKFDRGVFYEYKWSSHNDFDKCVELKCSQAGTFQIYFTLNKQEPQQNSFQHASGGLDILVQPELTLSNGKVIDINALQAQTVITKLLGTLDEWQSRLLVTISSGYNAIHFTPIEELSYESNSSYSIRNHVKLNRDASKGGKYTLNDVDSIVERLYNEHNCFSIADLVLNHMSNDSPFLKEHPQSAYNLINSPYLTPAFLLDRLFHYFTLDIEMGKYESRGLSSSKLEFHNLDQIRSILNDELIPQLKLHEFYSIALANIHEKLKVILNEKSDYVGNLSRDEVNDLWSKLTIIQDSNYNRLGCTIDFSLAKKIAQNLHCENSLDKIMDHLHRKNQEKQEFIRSCLLKAVDNTLATVKYHFFAEDGPKWTCINRKTPLVYQYFTYPFDNSSIDNEEEAIKSAKYGQFAMAHNGWVMNHDPLKNFALSNSLVYLKRELIVWGDSVKLRYGDTPQDSPELWQYMSEYTQRIVSIFHGVRLDNCHNTPLHVAQYMLDVARSIRPNLFVIAELFTNNEQTDNLFISKLGITLLVREAMNAWNSRELGRLIHRYGGDPVGSFLPQQVQPLKESISPALFYDITHDNRSLIKTHSVYNALPTSALILMCNCAHGSTRGYDELVPDEIHVVNEKRLYAKWSDDDTQVEHDDLLVGDTIGIIRAKRMLNNLHFDLNEKGFSEIYVDQVSDDLIAVTRHNPNTLESVVLLARSAFQKNGSHSNTLNYYQIPLKFDRILFEAKLVEHTFDYVHKEHHAHINGLLNYDLKIQENLALGNVKFSFFVRSIDAFDDCTHIYLKNFPPGSIIAFHMSIGDDLLKKSAELRVNISSLSGGTNASLDEIINRLTFDELNILLYRCSDEEIDENISSSVYDVPNYGPLVFCGLQGFVNILLKTRLNNDLGHPLYQNLRDGNWMLDYIVNRLKLQSNPSREALDELATWLNVQFELIKPLPRSLIPSYFDAIVTSFYKRVIDRCLMLMNLTKASSFYQFLGLASIQLTGRSRTAKLPNTLIGSSIVNDDLMSIAAGLPHFSHGLMRNWGRDTFISLKGLLLLCNRHKDAKYLILTYASTLRHGLIPNLLGEGIASRYNARDAVWWWLKAIKDYCELVSNGYEILNESVYRLYPQDDSPYPLDIKQCPIQKLSDIIQEALEKHAHGLKFVERNAGSSIDEHMSEEGFHNEIGINLDTGFVFGGNKYNCGTWMDKMGSSMKANNKGVPASPRDGSAVELVGLLRSVLEWLINSKYYPHEGVTLPDKSFLSWTEWASNIDKNFEKFFWIDGTSTESKLVNRRNIYKDCVDSSLQWTDYQLRPNFLIALCEAPQMISRDRAQKALAQVKAILLSDSNQLGIKTLDPSDWNYCGTYDNANDSSNPRVAHGFNYHQGPEWIWPMSYYLRALLKYSPENEREEAVRCVKSYLAKYNEHIQSVDWKSLPELTNVNGQPCQFSCPSQAWSIACIMEVCHELENEV